MELFDTKDYQALARRTQNKELTDGQKLNHSLIGLAAETLEVVGLGEEQRDDILEEAGDVCWMLAEYCDMIGLEMPVVTVMNTMIEESIDINEATSIMVFGVMKLLSTHQKSYQGHEIDGAEIISSVHIILSGIKFMAESLESSLTEVMHCNIAKLEKRYPDGFDADRSRNREE